MNILHCICSFNNGGAEKLLIDLVNNINLNKDDKVSICVTNKSYDYNLLSKIDKNIEVIKLERPESSKNYKYILEFINLIKKDKIEIIHCHNRGSYKFAMIAKLIYGNKVKIVYTIHDTNIYKNISSVYKFLDKFIVNQFIAISNSVSNELLNENIDKEKVAMIYNGIDIEDYIYSKKDKCEKNIVIGCVARLDPNKKGQDILINAIKEVKKIYPNVICKFAGDVISLKGCRDTSILDSLNKQVSELGLSSNIEFLGNVDDIKQFLSNLDIFVLPSRREGFGLSIVEAMAAKVPVIASNIDGPKEIIGNEYGELYEVENYHELAEKIIKIINREIIIDTEKVFKYVKNNYSIDIMSERYYKIYGGLK